MPSAAPDEAAPAPPLPPPLPMYRRPADAGAWHQVFAPGGYEWWHFDARSEDGGTHLVADFFDGDPFDPVYMGRYARFIRRPTRVPPPLPREYPRASFEVYRDGRLAAQFTSRTAPGELTASAGSPLVRIGPNAMRRDADGLYSVELEGPSLTAQLLFRPSLNQSQSLRLLHRDQACAAEHHWMLPALRCDVSGTITLGTPAPITFAGAGHHDHCFGTGAIAGLSRWMRDYLLTDDGRTNFQTDERPYSAARVVAGGGGSSSAERR